MLFIIQEIDAVLDFPFKLSDRLQLILSLGNVYAAIGLFRKCVLRRVGDFSAGGHFDALCGHVLD